MLNNHIQPCVSGSELNNLPHRLGNVCSVRSMYLRVKKKQLKLEYIRISPFMSCNFPCCYAFIKCKQVVVLSFLAFLTKFFRQIGSVQQNQQHKHSTVQPFPKLQFLRKVGVRKQSLAHLFKRLHIYRLSFSNKKYVELTFIVNPKDILAKCKFRSINLIWPFELALVNRLCNWKQSPIITIFHRYMLLNLSSYLLFTYKCTQ